MASNKATVDQPKKKVVAARQQQQQQQYSDSESDADQRSDDASRSSSSNPPDAGSGGHSEKKPKQSNADNTNAVQRHRRRMRLVEAVADSAAAGNRLLVLELNTGDVVHGRDSLNTQLVVMGDPLTVKAFSHMPLHNPLALLTVSAAADAVSLPRYPQSAENTALDDDDQSDESMRRSAARTLISAFIDDTDLVKVESAYSIANAGVRDSARLHKALVRRAVYNPSLEKQKRKAAKSDPAARKRGRRAADNDAEKKQTIQALEVSGTFVSDVKRAAAAGHLGARAGDVVVDTYAYHNAVDVLSGHNGFSGLSTKIKHKRYTGDKKASKRPHTDKSSQSAAAAAEESQNHDTDDNDDKSEHSALSNNDEPALPRAVASIQTLPPPRRAPSTPAVARAASNPFAAMAARPSQKK